MRHTPFRRLGWALWAGVALLLVVPAGIAVAFAFTDYDGLGAARFVGAENFVAMWNDPMVAQALVNSVYLALIVVPIRLFLACALALLLATPARGSVGASTAVFLPVAIPDTAHALLWAFLLNPLFGPVAELLRWFGVPAAAWLLGPEGARFSIGLALTYQLGEMFLIILALRREVPGELYAVAQVEGASRLFTFSHVTFPLIAPALGILAARDVAWTLQASFVPALVITQGGPLYATTFLPTYVYQSGFEFLRFGYASALTLLLLLITSVLMAVQLWLFAEYRTAEA